MSKIQQSTGFILPTNLITGRIFGIPNLYCPMGTLVAFSASERCSGSERRAVSEQHVSMSLQEKERSAYIAYTPSYCTFFTRS